MDAPWTPELVEERLIEAFAMLRRSPTVTMPGGTLRAVAESATLTEAELITVVMRLLACHEDERTALVVWAKNRAGVADLTVPTLLQRRGWPRQTFESMRRRGARIVCDGINAVRALAAA